MILRFTVEGKFSSAFTSSRRVKTIEEADLLREQMRYITVGIDTKKYSNFILYTENNIAIKRYY